MSKILFQYFKVCAQHFYRDLQVPWLINYRNYKLCICHLNKYNYSVAYFSSFFLFVKGGAVLHYIYLQKQKLNMIIEAFKITFLFYNNCVNQTININKNKYNFKIMCIQKNQTKISNNCILGHLYTVFYLKVLIEL